MAGMETDQGDDSQPQPATDSGASEPRPMSAGQHKHFRELAGHLIDNSVRAGHGGHMLGKAGPGNTGHAMPPNDLHKQQGAYLPQNVQSQFSDSGSADANPQGSDDYGSVDKNG